MKKLSLFAFIVALSSFINLFGIEKAILGIIFGYIAIKEDGYDSKLSKIAVIISFLYILIIFVITVIYMPEINRYIERLL